MTFSMKRVNAILQKDFKDISRNSAVSITALMPLILAFFSARWVMYRLKCIIWSSIFL